MHNDNSTEKRADFYRRIRQQHLTPLWEALRSLVRRNPPAAAEAALWRYRELRPFLLEAGDLISAEEAVRRVLVLENRTFPASRRSPEPLRRPATDPAGRDRPQPPAHPVGPALRRRGLRRLHLGGRRTHPHGAGRLHHHSVLDLARPRQPPRRGSGEASGLAGRPGHPDAAFLRRHLRRGYGRTGAAVATWRRRQPRPLRQQHAAAAPPADDADLAAVQLPLRAQPRRPSSAWRASNGPIPGKATSCATSTRPPAAGPCRPSPPACNCCRPASSGSRAQHRRQRLFGGGRQRRGADRRPALRLRGQDLFVVPSWAELRLEAGATDCVLFSFSDRPVQQALGILRESREPLAH